MEIIKLFKKYKVLKKFKNSSSFAQQAYYQKRLFALNTLFERLYGEELREKLFYVYDELCPDDEIQDILSYICVKDETSGVEVMAYDFPGMKAELNVRLFPVRIELSSSINDYSEVVWQAAQSFLDNSYWYTCLPNSAINGKPNWSYS